MKYIYVMQPKPRVRIGVAASDKAPPPGGWEIVSAIASPAAPAIRDAVYRMLAPDYRGGDRFAVSAAEATRAIEAVIKDMTAEHPPPRSFREILRQLRGDRSREDLVDEMGTTYWRIVGWEKKDHIPHWHWDKILDAAARRGRDDITRELLIELSGEHRKAKPQKKG